MRVVITCQHVGNMQGDKSPLDAGARELEKGLMSTNWDLMRGLMELRYVVFLRGEEMGGGHSSFTLEGCPCVNL